MHKSDANRLRKLERALPLAAEDMLQASELTKMLSKVEDTDENISLTMGLETGIAVCYARVFTQSSLLRLNPDKYAPTEPELAAAHHELLALRKKRYAHTDKDSGRYAPARPGSVWPRHCERDRCSQPVRTARSQQNSASPKAVHSPAKPFPQ